MHSPDVALPQFPTVDIAVFLPPQPSGIHERRAWLITSMLIEALSCHPVTEGYVLKGLTAKTCSGAIVFNSENDLAIIRHLRDLGIKTLYYPSFGPIQDGAFFDNTLFNWGHRLYTRLKMQSAHTVLVDSMYQAEVAQAHYDVTVPWLVNPGGGGAGFPRISPQTPPRVWAIEPCEPYASALWNWTTSNGYEAHRSSMSNAYRYVNTNQDIVFLADRYQAWHPDQLLAWMEIGVPLIIPESHLLTAPPKLLREYDDQADPNGIAEALDWCAHVQRIPEPSLWPAFIAVLKRFFEVKS